jgi:acyl-CoA oxidase
MVDNHDRLSSRSDATILMAIQETTAFMDMSLSVKAGVQWGLFGGSVASLGTEKHFHMLDKCQTLEVRGCFALTELGTVEDVALSTHAQTFPCQRS